MKKLSVVFVVLVSLMISNISNSNATMISGVGLNLNNQTEIGDGVEFIGIANYIGFDFEEFDDHTILTVTNYKHVNALAWLNYGNYTFSGFNDITNMYVLENNRFTGKIINNFKYDDDSVTLDFSIGAFLLSCENNQHLTFWIDNSPIITTPVPEPATNMLMFGGLLLLVGKLRKK